MDNFRFGIDYLGQPKLICKIDHFVDFGVDELVIIADQGKPDLGLLMQIVCPNLGYRSVEMMLQSGNNGFYDLSFFFQRTAIVDPKRDHSITDDHGAGFSESGRSDQVISGFISSR
jgi:hypothetical protein